MKHSRLLFILLIVIMFIETLSVYALEVNPDTRDWFEYELPDRNVMKGTALDASRLLDAPAGKHGYIKAKGDKLFFEDGTKAEFWGTNIVAEGNFMSKADSDKLVQTITTAGYNMVRFHHMDTFWSNPNIFGMDDERYNTLELDPEMLDRFDYLWSELKKNGVYLYIDLMCMRTAYEGELSDTVRDGLTGGFCTIRFFEPEILEISKRYMDQLLNHINPYTGTTLANDPACVVMDIINEDSLFIEEWTSWTRHTSIYYQNLVDDQFTQWLKEKYGTDEALAEAWKEEGKNGLGTNESLNGKVKIAKYYFVESMNYSTRRITDIREFFYTKMKIFYEEMYRYLKEEIQVKGLVIGSNYGVSANNTAELLVYAETGMDVHDQHAYYNHPASLFYMSSGDDINAQSFVPMLKNCKNNIINTFGTRRIYNMPYFQSEWCVALPNDYTADANYQMAAYSALNDWNPIHFELLQSNYIPSDNVMSLYLGFHYNPGYMATATASAYMKLGEHIAETDKEYIIVVNKDQAISRDFRREFPENMPFVGKTSVAFTTVNDSEDLAEATANNEEMKRLLNSSLIKSATHELSMNTNSGIFTVNTGRSKLLAGFTNGEKYNLDGVNIRIENEYATIAVTSLTDQNITNSDNILITSIARFRNTGQELDAKNNKIISQGTSPILIEPVSAEVEIKTDWDYTVYMLNSSGKRISIIPTYRNEKGLLVIDISENYQSNHFELVKQSEKEEDVTVTVDYINKVIHVLGETNKKFGRLAISVTNSIGEYEYLDQDYQLIDGTYKFSYSLDDTQMEVYAVKVKHEEWNGPVSRFFTVSSMESTLDIGTVSFTQANNTLNISFGVNVKGEDSESFVVFLAEYSEGVLVNSKFKNITVEGKGNETITLDIPYTTGNVYKLMTWNSLTGLKPLMEAEEYR